MDRTRLPLLAVASAAAISGVSTQDAHAHLMRNDDAKLRDKYQHLYRHVERKHGNGAAGRNIVDDGVRADRRTRTADSAEVARSIRVMRRMLAPPPPPAPAPAAQTASTTTAAPATGASAGLSAIAGCESGGNSSAVSPTGQYRGKYQFDQQTWESVGGTGDPAAAPEAEQDRRAATLYAQRGASPWPVCGR